MLEMVFSEKISAQAIMDRDKEMLDLIDKSFDPILHFYTWNCPSVTYGYFIDPKKYLNLKKCHKFEIDLARRPTGGGIVFHLWDLAFSFLLPSSHPKFSQATLENYFFVNSNVLRAIKDFLEETFNKSDLIEEGRPKVFPDNDFFQRGEKNNFCMAGPTKYDVVIGGKKVAGAAQRLTKGGYLHQGTIALTLPDKMLLEKLLLDSKVIDLISLNTYPLLARKENFDIEVNRLKALLVKEFEKSLC
jgi:lipoate---protein ligase